jgi:hypothetical protein
LRLPRELRSDPAAQGARFLATVTDRYRVHVTAFPMKFPNSRYSRSLLENSRKGFASRSLLRESMTLQQPHLQRPMRRQRDPRGRGRRISERQGLRERRELMEGRLDG